VGKVGTALPVRRRSPPRHGRDDEPPPHRRPRNPSRRQRTTRPRPSGCRNSSTVSCEGDPAVPGAVLYNVTTLVYPPS
jgi:hypothetical protein